MKTIRQKRFNPGEEVIVRNSGRTQVTTRGRVSTILLEGEVDTQDNTGRSDGVFHAKYSVRFDWNGFDQSSPASVDEFYDWELEPAKEK